MPKPRYEPLCALKGDCRGGRLEARPATQYVYFEDMTLYVCDACARRLFGLPSAATVRRRAERQMRTQQEVLPDA